MPKEVVSLTSYDAEFRNFSLNDADGNWDQQTEFQHYLKQPESLAQLTEHPDREAECRTFDREVDGSKSHSHCHCVPTPTQRAIPPWSVNE